MRKDNVRSMLLWTHSKLDPRGFVMAEKDLYIHATIMDIYRF